MRKPPKGWPANTGRRGSIRSRSRCESPQKCRKTTLSTHLGALFVKLPTLNADLAALNAHLCALFLKIIILSDHFIALILNLITLNDHLRAFF